MRGLHSCAIPRFLLGNGENGLRPFRRHSLVVDLGYAECRRRIPATVRAARACSQPRKLRCHWGRVPGGRAGQGYSLYSAHSGLFQIPLSGRRGERRRRSSTLGLLFWLGVWPEVIGGSVRSRLPFGVHRLRDYCLRSCRNGHTRTEDRCARQRSRRHYRVGRSWVLCREDAVYGFALHRALGPVGPFFQGGMFFVCEP